MGGPDMEFLKWPVEISSLKSLQARKWLIEWQCYQMNAFFKGQVGDYRLTKQLHYTTETYNLCRFNLGPLYIIQQNGKSCTYLIPLSI